jgi:small subunit ribosomal protein S2
MYEPKTKEKAMPAVTMRQLLEAGVHFGHQTRRWDPKMRPFIFGERNGIHILDLRQTITAVDLAARIVREATAKGGTVLFVGTKKQAQAAIQENALRAGMPYINHRWLGGMLTNFQTIHKRIRYMLELEAMEKSGELEAMTKKERLKLHRELVKLQAVLGGVRNLNQAPDVVFIIDVKEEHIAVTEASRIGAQVIAVVDTNCDPDNVDVVIPGNDDAIRTAELMAGVLADSALAGLEEFHAKRSKAAADADAAKKDADAAKKNEA